MSIPAGWYDDGSGRLRWWDGAQWTEHVAAPQSPSAAEAAPAVPQVENGSGVPAFTAPDAGASPDHSALYPTGTGYADASGYAYTQYPAVAPSASSRPSALGWVALGVSVAGAVIGLIPVTAGIGLLVLLAGLVLSIVALFRPGAKWPGIVGVVVSGLGAAATTVMLVLAFATSTFVAPFSGEPEPWPSPEAPEEETSTDGAETVDWWDIQVGDCLPEDQPAFEDEGQLVIVPCSEPHTDEVFYEYEMTQEDFPGDKAVYRESDAACQKAFADFVGIPYDKSELDVYAFYPTEDSWDIDDRAVQCVVYDPNGDVTGTLAGAAR